MRALNAVFWLVAWFAIAASSSAFGQPANAADIGRLIGEGILPCVLCFALDSAIRRRRA
jgi:hypothetical protein